MPIGDGTTVTGTTREEEDDEEEENDVIIKARRKKAIDDEASTGCSNARRFELELEFVQSLANPRYLHHLATTPNPSSSSRASSSKTNDEEENDVLNSPEMVGYLSYLRYWYEDPRYAKYILYPHSLYFLKLLQDPSFRRAMRNPRRVEEVHTAQFQFWANDVTERVKTILASKEEEKAPQDA